jgi:regulator of nucleoside diphosphate kinase
MNIKTPQTARRPRLIIDERAYPRLLALAERARAQVPDLADRLIEEIERADLRASSEMPGDVVTLGSEVTFRHADADMDVRGRATQGAVAERTQTVHIVAPEDADIEQRRISVLTPVGAALLGLAVGQKISWQMPDKREAVLEVVAVRQPNESPPH